VERILPRGRDDILEILFSTLVTVDRDGHAVRRRATHAELDGDVAVRSLVRELSGEPGRLLTSTEATVELSHDALLDKWPMLKGWIERNRTDMRLWAELEHDANNWLRPPHDNSLLWRGRKLQEARELLKREPPYLPKNITINDMKRFIKASIITRWKTRAYVSFTGFAFSLVSFAVIIVDITPSLLPRTPMPVGSFGDTHPFNLYDVFDNVWEWTQDCLATEDTLTGSSARAANSYDWCLARGGSWDNHEEWKVRASYRLPLARDHRAPTVDFRVARKVYDGETPGRPVWDCPDQGRDVCPQMVILPPPEKPFVVRAPKIETGPCENEDPRLEQPKDVIGLLAIGQNEVTVEEWDACKGCDKIAVEKRTNGRRPITNVSWKDAQNYVAWLTSHTNKQYRLPSGAEWEYAARGGEKGDKATCRWWDDKTLGRGKANCAACGSTWKQFFDWFRRSLQLEGRQRNMFMLF
jgi:formylglycine-generating enzyme required for sulfatase activity